MNAATVAPKRPVLGRESQSKENRENGTYKDEGPFGVSLPIVRQCSVLSLRFGKVNVPDLARRVAALGWTSSEMG
jgi:hypothetical protein